MLFGIARQMFHAGGKRGTDNFFGTGGRSQFGRMRRGKSKSEKRMRI
jgi:hypothetical protein